MSTNTNNRPGNADDVLLAPEAAAVLGMTVTSFEVGRSTGYAPQPIGKDGARLLFRRGDLWVWLDNREAGRAKVCCGIVGCRRQGYAKSGYCPEHARRVAVLGTTVGVGLIPKRTRDMSEEERFASYVVTNPRTGCEEWVGAHSAKSQYGHTTDSEGRTVVAHVRAFFLEHGRMPNEELDHECANRSCTRLGPGHAVEVSKQENMRRMFERLAARKAAESAAHADVVELPSAWPTAADAHLRSSVPVADVVALALEAPASTTALDAYLAAQDRRAA